MSKSSWALTARAQEILRTRLLRFPGPALLAGIALAAGAANAQDYPNRPIRLIIPYGTGGITDITARIVAPRIADNLGQQVVVENRPGGAAIPGFDLVAKARPDGYIAVLATTALAANPILFRKLPYDAEKDFAPVSLVATAPTVLAVHPSIPAHSVKELIALAKSKPGAMNYGSAGNGSDNHLTAEVFKNATGIDVLHIPYKGGGAVMTDLVGGQVAFVFATIPTAHPYITGGRLRALGVSSLKRNAALPGVPTLAESGLPGFNVNAWLGILVPAGTPANVIDRLRAATVTALQRPEVSERLMSMGLEPVGSTPAQLATHLKTEMTRWARLAREVKFEAVD
ncbi:MAG: tripartite tricarboxylate transporter substrate binding protein [Betaproteobacteria bacterium]|nr:tripartite tricarboxylate transporter substrate binding protein [Betaproteobacteria bacterium]MBI3056157.1 tripartite tricarboxylate transporter substrate binding protein [Betaproteobacteria bacterium]